MFWEIKKIERNSQLVWLHYYLFVLPNICKIKDFHKLAAYWLLAVALTFTFYGKKWLIWLALDISVKVLLIFEKEHLLLKLVNRRIDLPATPSFSPKIRKRKEIKKKNRTLSNSSFSFIQAKLINVPFLSITKKGKRHYSYKKIKLNKSKSKSNLKGIINNFLHLIVRIQI